MQPIDMALEALHTFITAVAAFLPNVLLAALIAITGWLLAKAARFAIVKTLRSINFHVLTERGRIDAFLQMGGAATDTTAVLGILVYWLVIVAALILACNTLGLTYVTDLLSRIALFVPRVMLAVIIIAFGAYFALFIDGTVSVYGRNVGFDEAGLLGRLARYAVLFFVVLIALDQLGIAGDIIRLSFLISLAGIVLALALAFGLGGQRWAAQLLERWWPQARNDETNDDE